MDMPLFLLWLGTGLFLLSLTALIAANRRS